ncbi:MAG: hemolysin family protein [Actinomycetota bacterium]|nr:hemolysin family protein [Actinomycetota bacterium]
MLAVLALVLANALFVAGEFSLVAADRTRVEQLSEDGSRRAARTLQALKTLSFQLSGAQLGITITSLIVGFVAEPAIGELLVPVVDDIAFLPEGAELGVSFALALVIATAFQMVVGELVPKNLAIAKPLTVAFIVVGPMMAVNRLLRPLIVFLNEAANWTVRRFGIEPQEELIAVRSLEELDLLIHSSRKEGTLAKEDFELLAKSIDFGTKSADDALVPRVSVVALHEDDTVARMFEVAVEHGYSRFPVYGRDLDDVVGIAYVKDGYGVPLDQRATTPVSEVMQDVLVVPESRRLNSLLVEMRRRRRHMAIVLDEHGGTAGIVTLEDLLEEIVGEIEDEHDPTAGARLTQPPEGIHLVSGLLHRSEVEDATGFEMPDGHYETLAGFLLDRLERIPEPGDHVSHAGWEFKVVEMEGRRISQVLCVAPAQVPEEEQT